MKNKKIYPWVVVGLLWVVALLNYMDRQMLSTMQEAMKVDIVELNKAEAFGALMAVFLWIYGFMSPVAGVIADRVSRKWLIVGSLFVWSAVTYLMGYATDFHELYWLRATMGVSEALYIPSALSLIADWHQDKSRSLAIGIHMTGLYTGQAIGGFGATVAAAFSWQLTFHWFGIVGIVYALVLVLFLHENPTHIKIEKLAKETPRKKGSVFSGLAIVLSNWAFWIILFYFAAPSLPGWATKNWLPTLFSESLNIPMAEAGPISTITIALSSFIGVIVGGVLSDKWVQKNIRGRVYTPPRQARGVLRQGAGRAGRQIPAPGQVPAVRRRGHVGQDIGLYPLLPVPGAVSGRAGAAGGVSGRAQAQGPGVLPPAAVHSVCRRRRGAVFPGDLQGVFHHPGLFPDPHCGLDRPGHRGVLRAAGSGAGVLRCR